MGWLRDILGRRPADVSVPAAGQRLAAQAAPTWKAMGNAALAGGDLVEAARCYGEGVLAAPGDAALHLNLGFVLLEQGEYGAAAERLARTFALCAPGDELAHEAHYLLGRAQRGLGEAEAALASFVRSVELRPGFTPAVQEMVALAHGLYTQGRHDQAREALDAVLEAQPDHTGALEGRGSLLLAMDQAEQALEDFNVLLARSGPNAQLLSNRAAALHRSGRLEEALASADEALVCDPGHRDAAYNRGRILLDLLRLPEAQATLTDALARYPDDADLRWNRATVRLLAGEFAGGWQDYEARWQADAAGARERPTLGRPRWSGREDLDGRSIAVLGEQGLGDNIQFARYLPLLRERGARVVFRVASAACPLFATSLGDCTTVAEGTELPATDLEIPLLALPLAFGTSLETVPADVPYLRSDPALLRNWRHRLGAADRLRVGLVWSGSTGHRNDRNRSIPLSSFAQLAVDGVQFVSLQKEVRAGDAAALEAWPGERAHFGDELRTLADTAALVQAMDLVISVDTSVAHLAGALGCPVWILLPQLPDWRWLLGREDSPWYPSARLFRQQVRGDWSDVLARVRRELLALSQARAT